MVVFVVQRIDRYPYFCVYLVLLLYQSGSAQLDFYLLKTFAIFDLIIRWVESSDCGSKYDDLGHRILKSDFIPSEVAISDCISRPTLFSDQKIKIGSSESDHVRINLVLMGYDYGTSISRALPGISLAAASCSAIVT